QLEDFAHCTRINLYTTVPAESLNEEIKDLLSGNKYEMMLFTSPSGIQNFLKLVGEIEPQKIRMACIGETTSKTAIDNHITPLVVAQNNTAMGLFESVNNYYKNKNL
ncbi:MAG TPA: uroporphyrinogen-III synthase, partial [Draconibacterium sp.]|nr:uroporphyrinogen-III synthase [Draconibacterium sp.]